MWDLRRVAGGIGLIALIGALCVVFAAGHARPSARAGDSAYGPFGPEGPRLREQLWMLPGADPSVPLRATIFRPREAMAAGEARRPLAVINHGSDDNTREAVSMPVFYWLSKWFVDRGYVVVLPQRRGHGATGGEMAEGRDACADPDHYGSGMAAASDIESAVRYMSAQPFVDPEQTVVVGVSSGGWAALALAARNPPGVRAVINFAGGRGGHAYGQANAVCAPERLIEAAGAFARAAKMPTLWLYAGNDSYFAPALAASMARAWHDNGGLVEFHLLPPHRADGHEIVADRTGAAVWGPHLERALTQERVAHGRGQRFSGVR